jgi:hypothetical protein
MISSRMTEVVPLDLVARSNKGTINPGGMVNGAE